MISSSPPACLPVQADAYLRLLAPGARAAIVTDTNVDAAWGDALRASLDASGVEHATHAVAPGERSKGFDTLQIRARIHPRRPLRAWRRRRGAWAAAWWAISRASPPPSRAAAWGSSRCPRRCWRRSIPRSAARPASTRRRARTSSAPSISPALVLADLDALATLPDREFRAGYAEIAKYGLIDRPDFFDWLEANENARSIAARTRNARAGRRDLLPGQGRRRAHRRVRARGSRALLNLGPHIRPRAGSPLRLRRRAAGSRRGRRDRHGAGARLLRPARPVRSRTTRRASPTHLEAHRPADAHRRYSRPSARICPIRCVAEFIAPGQEGRARRAHLHPHPRASDSPSSPGTSIARRCPSPSWRSALSQETTQ